MTKKQKRALIEPSSGDKRYVRRDERAGSVNRPTTHHC